MVVRSYLEKKDDSDVYNEPFFPVLRKDEKGISFLIQPLNRDFLAVQPINQTGGEIEYGEVRKVILLYSKGSPLGFYYKKRFCAVTKEEFETLFVKDSKTQPKLKILGAVNESIIA
jgi:hypothetical protein